MTSRGDLTRQRILDAAEQLMGERGVSVVSLREIGHAAGQRNVSALQFHFGDRAGLLRAIVARHAGPLAAIRDRLLGDLGDLAAWDATQRDPRPLVEALVRPPAEYVGHGTSARAYVKIASELVARPERGLRDLQDASPPDEQAVGVLLHRRLLTSLPTDLALERLLVVPQSCLHLCADRARIEDAEAPGRPPLPFDRWVDDLVDQACGALFASSRAAAPG